MRFTYFCLSLTVLFLLCGCSEMSRNEKLKTNWSFQTENGQSFNIVEIQHLMERYIKDHDEEDAIFADYKEAVIDPIYNDCFLDGEFLHIAEDVLSHNPENFDKLQRAIERMNSKEVKDSLSEALELSAAALPIEKEINVCLLPVSYPGFGMAVGSDKILILFDEYLSIDRFKVTLAHEYHHSAWQAAYREPSEKWTVLDNMVFEGKAVMFQEIIYPNQQMINTNEIYDQEAWDYASPHFEKGTLEHSNEILYGGFDPLPPLYGYSEGYRMVKNYIEKNPKLSIPEWTKQDAATIFKEGNHEENYD